MTGRAAIQRIVDVVRTSGPLWAASLIVDRIMPTGVLGWWPVTIVSAAVLSQQIDSILRAWGMSVAHVAVTVPHILYADLRGIDSHGSAMLRHYREGLGQGWLTMQPAIAVERQETTTAVIDGGGGLGHVPADMAMRMAIDKAKQFGLGAVAIRNSNHFGAAGAYVSLATAEGLIGIATTTTRQPAVVPTFGAEAKLGTNAIAFAVPAARNEPFLLDMATSAASLGAVVTAWRAGRAIPIGWAVDAHGRPVARARIAAESRRLQPLGSQRALGSHKGYGLGVVAEILSSVLAGSRYRDDGSAEVGHFMLAIDPERFRDAMGFTADVDGLLDRLRATPPAEPAHAVLVAGDPEHAAYAERSRTGIPLARSVVEDIRAVARDCGAPFLLRA